MILKANKFVKCQKYKNEHCDFTKKIELCLSQRKLKTTAILQCVFFREEWLDFFSIVKSLTFRILKSIKDLKLELFGLSLSIDIVISVKSLLTETTISIDNKMPHGLSFKNF